jgi:nucleoside-triphosphatase THEP1
LTSPSLCFIFLSVILILTGPVQSGKTRFLTGIISGLDKTKTGVSGFLSPAVYEGDRLIGYDLAVLGREKPVPYIRKRGRPGWERIGPYFFIPQALRDARQTIMESRARDLLVVDEVGPLELGGGGVWGPLATVLASPGRRCLLVVRAACLAALPARLDGLPYKVFLIEEPAARNSLFLEIARGDPGSGLPAGRET